MLPLVIYWSPSLFWWVILPPCSVIVFLAFRNLDREEQPAIEAAAIVITIIVFVMAAAFTFAPRPSMTTDVVNEISGIVAAQEEKYYDVILIGKKQVVLNPSDGQWYVRIGNGQMLAFKTIEANQMCRNCQQFSDTSRVDSVLVYEATLGKGWFDSSKLFYSKQSDMVFEEARSTLVE